MLLFDSSLGSKYYIPINAVRSFLSQQLCSIFCIIAYLCSEVIPLHEFLGRFRAIPQKRSAHFLNRFGVRCAVWVLKSCELYIYIVIIPLFKKGEFSKCLANPNHLFTMSAYVCTMFHFSPLKRPVKRNSGWDLRAKASLLQLGSCHHLQKFCKYLYLRIAIYLYILYVIS